jgi:hypothetical protein
MSHLFVTFSFGAFPWARKFYLPTMNAVAAIFSRTL